MLYFGKKIPDLRDKKNKYSNSRVKNHNHPPLQVKWSVPKLKILTTRYFSKINNIMFKPITRLVIGTRCKTTNSPIRAWNMYESSPFSRKKFLSLCSIVKTTEWNGLIKIDN